MTLDDTPTCYEIMTTCVPQVGQSIHFAVDTDCWPSSTVLESSLPCCLQAECLGCDLEASVAHISSECVMGNMLLESQFRAAL